MLQFQDAASAGICRTTGFQFHLFFKDLSYDLQGFRRHDLFKRLRCGLFSSVSPQAHDGGADIGKTQIHVDNRYDVCHIMHHPTILLFAFPERLLHPPLVRNVYEYSAGALKLAVFHDRSGFRPRPSELTGFFDDSILRWGFYTFAEFRKPFRQTTQIIFMRKLNKVLPDDFSRVVSQHIPDNWTDIKDHTLTVQFIYDISDVFHQTPVFLCAF